jgi:hypothetical protein
MTVLAVPPVKKSIATLFSTLLGWIILGGACVVRVPQVTLRDGEISLDPSQGGRRVQGVARCTVCVRTGRERPRVEMASHGSCFLLAACLWRLQPAASSHLKLKPASPAYRWRRWL